MDIASEDWVGSVSVGSPVVVWSRVAEPCGAIYRLSSSPFLSAEESLCAASLFFEIKTKSKIKVDNGDAAVLVALLDRDSTFVVAQKEN